MSVAAALRAARTALSAIRRVPNRTLLFAYSQKNGGYDPDFIYNTDPEIRQAGENSVVGKFTIAVERDIPGKDGERGVDFIHCVAWNQLARFLSGYFQKGSAILVCGRLQMSRWKDENGSPHERAEISADTLYFGESSASKKARENQREDNALPFDAHPVD